MGLKWALLQLAVYAGFTRRFGGPGRQVGGHLLQISTGPLSMPRQSDPTGRQLQVCKGNEALTLTRIGVVLGTDLAEISGKAFRPLP